MTKRILHIVTNVSAYEGGHGSTGLWLSELTHAYDEFEKVNYLQDIVSPKGGKSPIDPKSLLHALADKTVKRRENDPAFMQRLEHTQKPSDINWQDYDAIYYAGGHGAMWDFLDNKELQAITQHIYEKGGIVSSVCHGYCGLLNVYLSNGERLIDGKKLTGFAWSEEILAGASKKIPYNAEQLAKEYGADYTKNLIPFAPHVESDSRLITGQNPFSARKTALTVIEALEK